MPYSLVEGWTEPIAYRVEADGEPVDLTGKTVDLIAYTKHGLPKVMIGTTDVTDPANGRVEFTPDPDDLLEAESPYDVRFHIVDDGYFSPNGVAERWTVRK